MIEERMGDMAQAEHDFTTAVLRDPGSFPRPPDVSSDDFAARVRDIVAGLPADVRQDIGQVHLETADIPATEDLVAEKPHFPRPSWDCFGGFR